MRSRLARQGPPRPRTADDRARLRHPVHLDDPRPEPAARGALPRRNAPPRPRPAAGALRPRAHAAQAALDPAPRGAPLPRPIPRSRVAEPVEGRPRKDDRRHPRRIPRIRADGRAVPRRGHEGNHGDRGDAGARQEGRQLAADERPLPRRRAVPQLPRPPFGNRRAARADARRQRRLRREIGQRLPRSGHSAARDFGSIPARALRARRSAADAGRSAVGDDVVSASPSASSPNAPAPESTTFRSSRRGNSSASSAPTSSNCRCSTDSNSTTPRRSGSCSKSWRR